MNSNAAFSSFSVDSIEAAKKFYSEILGCTLEDQMSGAQLQLPGGSVVWLYEKPNHQPATFTVLNFVVKDIDEAVEELTNKGIVFERYPELPEMHQDEKGIARGKEHNMGPDIAWFKDPSGNILSVMQE